jgi:hypothetical protein
VKFRSSLIRTGPFTAENAGQREGRREDDIRVLTLTLIILSFILYFFASICFWFCVFLLVEVRSCLAQLLLGGCVVWWFLFSGLVWGCWLVVQFISHCWRTKAKYQRTL